MPIEVNWYDDKKTISCIWFEGRVDLEGLFDAWARERELAATVDYGVYSMNIMRGTPTVGRGLSLSRLRGYLSTNPVENHLMTLQVSESAAFRGVLISIARLMPHEVHVVATVDEALAIVERHRRTTELENLPPR